MPYLYGLSTTYGRADQFYAITNPSQPNYLALWSGSMHGVTTNTTVDLPGESISSQMTAAGLSWRTYAQNYPATGCNTGSSYTGGIDGWGEPGTIHGYVRRHNPAMSFTSVSLDANECAKIQPLASFDPLVNFAFVVPNNCNNMHDCSLATGDAFLQAFLPQVFNSSDWAHTLLVVSFDEGSTTAGNHIFTVVAREGLSGFASLSPYDHYSLLRTIQDIFGLPCLANSCGAAPMTEFLPTP